MPKIGYYLFNSGINYRDSELAINELSDGNNLYWEGNLKRRKGYQRRHAVLSTVGNYSPKAIYDHIRLKTSTIDYHFLVVGMATGTNVSKITAYYKNGLPTATSDTYTMIGTGNWVNWTTNDPLSIDVVGEKLYLALGDNNPYVIYSTNGSTWNIKELPLCYYLNGSISTGAGIINNSSGSSGNWKGSKIAIAGQGLLFVSDAETAFYGIYGWGLDPAKYIESTSIANQSSGIKQSWGGVDNNGYIGLDPNLRHYKAIAYKKFIYFVGYDGFQILYPRFIQGIDDYDLITENFRGIYGGVNINKNGVFFVGKDGIYGYDGTACYNLSKKLWPHIKKQHTSIPDDFKDSSITNHDNYIWVSFPESSQKEIYIFEPDHIYTDEHDESHAPCYRFGYVNGTGRQPFGFKKLKEYENHLYGVNGDRLYELDTEGLDNKTTDGGEGISFKVKTAYLSQDNPGVAKSYKQVVLETDEGISDGTTSAKTDLRMGFSINHTTAADYRAITSTGAIDMEYITGGGRAFKTIDIPMTTSNYALDGNSMAFEIIGESSRAKATGEVNIFGFSLIYELQKKPEEEAT